MITCINDIPDGEPKQRLLNLPNFTEDGFCDWVEESQFLEYGFKSGNGLMRNEQPQRFPKGLLWKIERSGNKIIRIRCTGFSSEEQLTHCIASFIRHHFVGKPCTITGTFVNVEIDHRAGNKSHVLHVHADNHLTQSIEDFMPLCRTINHIKREKCKRCINTGIRPNLPPFLGGGPMKTGNGCYGCFWMQPEIYRENEI